MMTLIVCLSCLVSLLLAAASEDHNAGRGIENGQLIVEYPSRLDGPPAQLAQSQSKLTRQNLMRREGEDADGKTAKALQSQSKDVVQEVDEQPSAVPPPEPPEAKGCYIWKPTTCPHASSLGADPFHWAEDWILDIAGMQKFGSGQSRTACKQRKTGIDLWCQGLTDTMMLFVEAKVKSTTTVPPKAAPKFWGRKTRPKRRSPFRKREEWSPKAAPRGSGKGSGRQSPKVAPKAAPGSRTNSGKMKVQSKGGASEASDESDQDEDEEDENEEDVDGEDEDQDEKELQDIIDEEELQDERQEVDNETSASNSSSVRGVPPKSAPTVPLLNMSAKPSPTLSPTLAPETLVIPADIYALQNCKLSPTSQDAVPGQVVSIGEAKIICQLLPTCVGFSYEGLPETDDTAKVMVRFKSEWACAGTGATSYRKKGVPDSVVTSPFGVSDAAEPGANEGEKKTDFPAGAPKTSPKSKPKTLSKTSSKTPPVNSPKSKPKAQPMPSSKASAKATPAVVSKHSPRVQPTTKAAPRSSPKTSSTVSAKQPAEPESSSDSEEVCEKSTGAMCTFSECAASRFAICADSQCLCAGNTCSVAGRCIEREKIESGEPMETESAFGSPVEAESARRRRTVAISTSGPVLSASVSKGAREITVSNANKLYVGQTIIIRSAASASAEETNKVRFVTGEVVELDKDLQHSYPVASPVSMGPKTTCADFGWTEAKCHAQNRGAALLMKIGSKLSACCRPPPTPPPTPQATRHTPKAQPQAKPKAQPKAQPKADQVTEEEEETGLQCSAPTGVTHQLTPGCKEGETISHKSWCTPQCMNGKMPWINITNGVYMTNAAYSTCPKGDSEDLRGSKLCCANGKLWPPRYACVNDLFSIMDDDSSGMVSRTEFNTFHLKGLGKDEEAQKVKLAEQIMESAKTESDLDAESITSSDEDANPIVYYFIMLTTILLVITAVVVVYIVCHQHKPHDPSHPAADVLAIAKVPEEPQKQVLDPEPAPAEDSNDNDAPVNADVKPPLSLVIHCEDFPSIIGSYSFQDGLEVNGAPLWKRISDEEPAFIFWCKGRWHVGGEAEEAQGFQAEIALLRSSDNVPLDLYPNQIPDGMSPSTWEADAGGGEWTPRPDVIVEAPPPEGDSTEAAEEGQGAVDGTAATEAAEDDGAEVVDDQNKQE